VSGDVGAPLLRDVARVLAEEAGLSLWDGLDTALRDGLEAAARVLGERPEALARRILEREPAALAALVEHSAVGETVFWRHPEQLAAVGRIAGESGGPLSIWSAGCATGEEPYSVAMALLEAGRAGKGDRILATDVSERALEVAAAGVYGPRPLRRLPPDLARRWIEGGEERRVSKEVRGLVTFVRHNLVADPVPGGGPFDLVLCRNVLIYFSPDTATTVLDRLARALRPGGLLLLGPVELPIASALGMDWVEHGGATFLRRGE